MNLHSLQRQFGTSVCECACVFVCNPYSRSRLIRRKQSDLALHTQTPTPTSPANPDWRNNYTSRSNVCCGVVLWLLLCRFVRFARFLFLAPFLHPHLHQPTIEPPSSLVLLRCPIRAFCFVVGHTHIHAHAHTEKSILRLHKRASPLSAASLRCEFWANLMRQFITKMFVDTPILLFCMCWHLNQKKFATFDRFLRMYCSPFFLLLFLFTRSHRQCCQFLQMSTIFLKIPKRQGHS